MPWYKLTARNGPGHQSKSEKYDWFGVDLSDKEKCIDAERMELSFIKAKLKVNP